MDLCAKGSWDRSFVKSLFTYFAALLLYGVGAHWRGPLELAVCRDLGVYIFLVPMKM